MADPEDISSFLGVTPPENPPVLTTNSSEPATQEQSKQGPAIGGWICLGLGILAMKISIWMFIIYGPLLLAAFILAITALSQGRITNGLPLLLSTIVLPLMFGVHRVGNTLNHLADKHPNVPTLSSAQVEPLIPVEYEKRRFSWSSLENYEVYRGKDGNYWSRARTKIDDGLANKLIFNVDLFYAPNRDARLEIGYGAQGLGMTRFLIVNSHDTIGINQLRTFFSKAKQWSAIAKSEGVSNYQKQIGVMNSTMCIARDDHFGGVPGTADYAVTFFAKDPRSCVVNLRGFQGGVPQTISLDPVEWDALLFITDTLGGILANFKARSENDIAANRNELMQEAKEKSRRDKIFK